MVLDLIMSEKNINLLALLLIYLWEMAILRSLFLQTTYCIGIPYRPVGIHMVPLGKSRF